jgi:hypothetical protein
VAQTTPGSWLLEADSFDNFTTAQASRFGWTSTTTVQAGGRFGTNCMALGNNQEALKAIPGAARAKAGLAFAMSFDSYPTVDCGVVLFRDGATYQTRLLMSPTGVLKIFRGDGATLLGSATSLVLLPNTSYHIEFKVTFATGATGAAVVRVNGVTVAGLNLASVQTAASGVAQATGYGLARGGTGGTCQRSYDDVILYDPDGAGFPGSGFVGDQRVEETFPNGNGATSNFLGSDGNSVDNYLLYDEATANDDTDYVASSTAGDIDLATMGNVTPTTGNVTAVVTRMTVRKDDAGTRTVAPAIRSGGSNAFGTNQNIGSTYEVVQEVFQQNPVSVAAWTIADVNGVETGAKLVA